MTITAAAAPVRITLHGPAHSVDTGVWGATTTADLLDEPGVRSALGLRAGERAVVVSRARGPLDDARPVLDQHVDEGDVLTVLVLERPQTEAGHGTTGRGRRTGRAGTPTTRPVSPVLVGVALLVAAGLVAIPAGGAVRTVTASLLLTVAMTGAVAVPRDRWGERCRVLAPLAAAAGVFTLLADPGPGRMHLALTAAAVSAAVTAATARAASVRRANATPPPVVDHLLVLLALAGGVSAVLGGGLLLGMPLRSCAVVLAAAAALAPRLLPPLVLNVPDEALLALDRLSVTAWSAHERLPQRAWRRLKANDVSDLIARARRLFSLTTVLCSALAATGVAGALSGDPLGSAWYGSLALAVCIALSLALAARTVRDRAGHASLLAVGAATGVAVAVAGLVGAHPGWRIAAFASAVLAAAAIVPAALALGRGWRSVRWARAGDVVEGLAVALVAPAAFVAAGGFDWVRQLVA